MSYLFDGCSSIETLPDISKWNTNNIRDLNAMFRGCSSLKSLPDISKLTNKKLFNITSIIGGNSSLISFQRDEKIKRIKIVLTVESGVGCNTLAEILIGNEFYDGMWKIIFTIPKNSFYYE